MSHVEAPTEAMVETGPASSWKPQERLETTAENVFDEVQKEEARVHARARAVQLSEEAASAFRDMDANMVRNDEKTLYLLGEIKQSFEQLAKLGNLPLPSSAYPSFQVEASLPQDLPTPTQADPAPQETSSASGQ